jgi:hypothetical protein
MLGDEIAHNTAVNLFPGMEEKNSGARKVNNSFEINLLKAHSGSL